MANVAIVEAALRLDAKQFTKTIEQRAGHLKPALHSLLVAAIEQRPLALLTHVPGNPIRSVGAVERPLVDRQMPDQFVELGPEPVRYELLVESRPQLRHCVVTRRMISWVNEPHRITTWRSANWNVICSVVASFRASSR